MSSEVETSLKFRFMPCDHDFCVYIVNEPEPFSSFHWSDQSALRRIWEHRGGSNHGFGSKYQCKELIYHQYYRGIRDAIGRESRLVKGWRAKRIGLINRINPQWEDLGADVLHDR
ncbi:MAG: endonuclease [Verrucomicrobia bacterium]|nr:MAG: endonuclease [Verrucomicrobiota bacterium]